MTVKNALLALLAGGPAHGYQLKLQFDRATGAGWPLNVGQVYSTLQRLERDDLVVTDGPVDGEGRQAYVLTALGRETLREWFEGTEVQALAARDPVSLKVLMAAATAVVPAVDVISRQRAKATETLQALGAMRAQGATESLAWRLHLDRMILLAESEIRWLELAEQRVEAAAMADDPQHGRSRPTGDSDDSDEEDSNTQDSERSGADKKARKGSTS